MGVAVVYCSWAVVVYFSVVVVVLYFSVWNAAVYFSGLWWCTLVEVVVAAYLLEGGVGVL